MSVKFMDILKKEFLYEEVKKSLKIFYKLNINIIKAAGATDNSSTPAPDANAAPQTPAPDAAAPAAEPAQVDTGTVAVEPAAAEPAPADMGAAAPVAGAEQAAPSTGFSSVVTEVDDASGGNDNVNNADEKQADKQKENKDVEVTDENTIVRKMEGAVTRSADDVDEIQTVEDMVNYLVNTKQNGTNVLDEFTSNVMLTLISPNASQISTMIDKKSNIFMDMFYGYEKDDSVGIRIIKRKDSDSVSVSMLIDNELVPTKITNMDTVNDRIVGYRNDSVDDKEDNSGN